MEERLQRRIDGDWEIENILPHKMALSHLPVLNNDLSPAWMFINLQPEFSNLHYFVFHKCVCVCVCVHMRVFMCVYSLICVCALMCRDPHVD